MRAGKVQHMDVVADAGTVGRPIVVTEDRHLVSGHRGPKHDGDEVGLGPVVFPQRFGGPGGVEVPQRDASKTVGLGVPGEGALERPLRFAVGVDRAQVGVLSDWRFARGPIDRRGGAEDEALDPMAPCRFKECDPTGHVVAVVAGRVADRLAHQRAGRAVEDGVKRLAGEQVVDSRRLAIAPDLE